MIDSINEVLEEIHDDIISTDWKELTDDGLFSGKLGLVYFYHILYKSSGDALYRDKIEEILADLIDRMTQSNSSVLRRSSLMSGLTGFGYILKLLVEEELIDEDFLGQLDSINELALAEGLLLIENKNFDFFNGPIGILFYFTAIGHTENISLIVDKLYAEFIANGQTFYNDAGYLEGIHFGYAHGLPAIVKTLDGIKDNAKSDEMILHLMNEFRRLIETSHITLADTRYYLPRSIHKNKETIQFDLNWRPVLAWSNSDLNYSTLVYSINPDRMCTAFFDLAADMAKGTTGRKDESQTRVWDYRFNYGSAGVAQLYGNIYKHTGDTEIHNAYRYWITESIKFYKGAGKLKEHKLNFIDNLPALYLVLHEYVNPAISGWDKILLL